MKKISRISADSYGLFSLDHLVQALNDIGVTVYEDPFLEEIKPRKPREGGRENLDSSGVNQWENWILVKGPVSYDELEEFSREHNPEYWHDVDNDI